MMIRDVMRSNVVTVGPKATVRRVIGLTQERGIRHVVVTDGDGILGIVADRDLKRAIAAASVRVELGERALLAQIPVEAIMTSEVFTIGPAEPVEEAARTMLARRISALPVVESGKLVGIVTETDLLMLVAGGLASSGRPVVGSVALR